MLFIAMVVSNIGNWMQMVGAQWLLIDEPDATTLIALIQTAMTLPLALFALPAGILADVVDRRRMLVVVQAVQLVLALLLTVLVFLGSIHPWVLLGLLAAFATTSAFALIPFQSSIIELVPRDQVPMAAAMTGLSANIARAIGPALAGVLVARFGTPLVFALNTVGVAVYLGSIIMWRREKESRPADRETFAKALATGMRFVRHSPHIRRLLLRVVLFTVPAQAIWALLPLVAKRQLQLDVGEYGLLLAAIGVGAVGAASMLPRLRRSLGTNHVIAATMLAYAVSLAGLTLARSLAEALPLLAIAGFGWIGTLSTIGGSLQLYLPGWVRSRGGAINTLVLFGGQAAGAAIWGSLATHMSLQATYWIAAAIIAASSTLAWLRPLGDIEDLDRSHANYWPTPAPLIDPNAGHESVLVTIEYDIEAEDVEAYLEAMSFVRIVRLRSGGRDWELHRDVEQPHRFVESYAAASWEEHMRQHEVRLMESDRALEARATAFSRSPLIVQHYVHTSVPKR